MYYWNHCLIIKISLLSWGTKNLHITTNKILASTIKYETRFSKLTLFNISDIHVQVFFFFLLTLSGGGRFKLKFSCLYRELDNVPMPLSTRLLVTYTFNYRTPLYFPFQCSDVKVYMVAHHLIFYSYYTKEWILILEDKTPCTPLNGHFPFQRQMKRTLFLEKKIT